MQTNIPMLTTVVAQRAGMNKLRLTTCPFCSSQGDELVDPDTGLKARFFCFTDELSAREYRISGLCQSCQDGVFH